MLSHGISHMFSEFGCPGVVDLLRWAHTGVSTRTQTSTGTAVNKGVDLKRFASARMCKLFDVKGVRTINSAKKNGNLTVPAAFYKVSRISSGLYPFF